MELRQLEYFVTVAKELHFGRAAEQLHIVQSGVSQQIRRLESELGVQLFDRTTRTVALTVAGQRLLPYAEQILGTTAEARAALGELRVRDASKVRLGTSTGLGNRLDAILNQFSQLAPGAQLELANSPARIRLHQVATGQLDAALIRGRHPEDAALDVIAVWTDQLVAAIPAQHHLAVHENLDLAELAELPLRLAERKRNPALHDLLIDCCRQAGFEPTLGPAFTTDQDTLAAIGHGAPSWTVYYAAQAAQITAPGVVYRSLRHPQPMMPTYLVVRPGPRAPALDVLIKACLATDS